MSDMSPKESAKQLFDALYQQFETCSSDRMVESINAYQFKSLLWSLMPLPQVPNE